MAKGAYAGIGDTAKKVKKIYVGIGDVAKKVKKAYVGVGNVAKLWFSSDVNLAQETLSITLSARTTYTSNRTRGTVFNNRAIFNGGAGSSAANCKFDTITASFTKTSIASSSAYTDFEESAALSSYAFLTGYYSSSYSYRIINLNTSFAASTLTYVNSGGIDPGTWSNTSSYAIGSGVENGDGDYYGIAYNNSLSRTDIAVSSVPQRTSGHSYVCSNTFGDLILTAYYGSTTSNAVSTCNNSLTVTNYVVTKITGSGYFDSYAPAMAHVGGKMFVQGRMSAAPYYRIFMVNSSLTSTQVYTETVTNTYASNVAAGATPNAAIFVGGGTTTASTTQNRLIALDDSGTRIASSMVYPSALTYVQSCVKPLGDNAVFAGGRNGTSYSNSIVRVYET